MSKLPDLSLKSSTLYTRLRNAKGQLCNIYTPLLNLADETSKVLGDFSTEKLDFDLEHPVDIILLDAYDGAVNMIINDGKNRPRLINSRFSVLDENTFKIPDHSGFKDTNIYDESTFNVDTLLKAIPIQIPAITYNGLIDNGGRLNCGSYTFYFKLADADGNETEVIAESGIVQCHIGNTNSPNSIRMGLLDENSNKAISFTLSNIDAGFDFIHVLFSRSSSSDDLATATTYNKVIFDYPVSEEHTCNITITGAETIIGVSKEECMVDYADINSVKTQTINNNVLLFGNVDTPEHDWDAIKRFTWKIIPKWKQADEGSIGSLDSNYRETSLSKEMSEDHGYCYYNTRNVYYRLGYWPDEIYRFGIVYIFEDNSLSPVINLLGIDFSTVNLDDDVYVQKFFMDEEEHHDYVCEPDDLYFNKTYRTNPKGVIKFPEIDVIGSKTDKIVPRPLYLQFDLSYIGYEYASGNHPYVEWLDVLKKHKIKGFFFVRQKRIPTILGLGVVIGLSRKECGALPVIKNQEGNYVVLSFLDEDRLILEEASDVVLSPNSTLQTSAKGSSAVFKNQAMLCPDAEISEATYNQLFVSNKYSLKKKGNYSFRYDDDSKTSYTSSFNYSVGDSYKAKLTNVPEDTKLITNGTDYFSTLAGNPNEPYKTVDMKLPFRWSKPLDLTTSTSLIRGKWGPYVGLSNPNEENPETTSCPFSYGDLYNIKTEAYDNPETATELDFQKAMNSHELFFAITHRMESKQFVDAFRGDCFISMFTHRMFRNFIDPELPTNNKVVNPACWAENYCVRCTAPNVIYPHSNLTADELGFYIEDDPYVEAIKACELLIVIYFLTGNFIGGFFEIAKLEDLKNEQEKQNTPILEQYPNGFANEIVLAFEVYTGGASGSQYTDTTDPLKNFSEYNDHKGALKDSATRKKKVNPKELETSGGFNLKAIFKCDDNWSLRGLASINRADINAVAMGQWITFPVCSNKNLAMRDVDFSNATEEASFNRKRSFYPLSAKQMSNPLRDSNVINSATGITLPQREYIALPKVPYFKLEYFTRILNSLRDSSSSVTNAFKVMLESAYHDYTKIYGSITKLESRGDYVYIIFKHGIGILNMTLSIQQAQDANYFLSEASIISETYGSLWKDSIIQTPSGIYGVDSVAKVIWMILGTTVKIISDMKVEKFLIDNLDMSEFNFRPFIGHINIKSHYNAFKHDVMFTYYNDLLYLFPERYNHISNTIDLDGFVCDLEGNRIIVDNKNVKATRLLPSYNEKTHLWLSYSDLILNIEYQWVKGTNWSLCWNEDLQAFLTFYDWIPVESENIDNIYFSFDRDAVYDSSVSPTRYLMTVSNNKNIRLGIILKKNTIDKAFTNETTVYYIKKNYDNIGNSGMQVTLSGGLGTDVAPLSKAIFSCYIYFPNKSLEENTNSITISASTTIGPLKWTLTDMPYNKWLLLTFIIENGREKQNCQINKIVLSNNSNDYTICEPKITPYGECLHTGQCRIILPTLISLDSQAFKDLYNVRSMDNSMKLWKHGQSGVYDNQGKIKPTNWYGKQHEFNFEFVVNENSSILKIFNNLKIISNKAEPYKFEYEIVGEGYEWFEYKKIVYWINLKVKEGIFVDDTEHNIPALKVGYITVLSTPYKTLLDTYSDFPDLFYDRIIDENWKIPKLPYFEIKLADKKGIPDKDKSYTTHTTKVDNWSAIKLEDTYKLSNNVYGRQNDYKFNTSEAIIVEDTQLNEYRVHTESYGNNMKKYGRVRGNMEYLEDLWDVEIRPIPVKWVFLETNGTLSEKIFETRHRDKYIKIKVRYTGEDLVIIQAIQTMFDYSFA